MVEQLGGRIARDRVPAKTKTEAEERAEIWEVDGVTQYACMHEELAATSELQEECDKLCHEEYGSFYYRHEMQLCHKQWSINDQNQHGCWGESYGDCGKLRSNRNHEIALCCKPCHLIIRRGSVAPSSTATTATATATTATATAAAI
jgi:hypothetical protein